MPDIVTAEPIPLQRRLQFISSTIPCVRTVIFILGALTALSPPAPAQPEVLAFEVASVRQNTSGSSASRISGPTPARFTIVNVPLRFIILHAYNLRDHELIDAPPSGRIRRRTTSPPLTLPA